MSATVSRKMKFNINVNVGDDETSENQNVQTSVVAVLTEKVRKFIHSAKQFKSFQKMNKELENEMFNVFFRLLYFK